MKTIFTIAEDLLALDQLLDECCGELTPETEPAFEAFFAELKHDQAIKLDAYANLLRHLESQAAVARATAEGFRLKAQIEERKVERIKQRILAFLQATNQKTATTVNGWTFAVQANGGQAPVEIEPNTDPQSVETKYQRVRVEIDRDLVRKAIAAGESVSFARLGERGVHLRLKP